MPIIVKGKYLNGKPPVVCVPVIEKSFAGIIDQVSKLCDKDVSMIEWRADYFEELLDIDRVKDLLNHLRDVTKNVLFLITIRSKSQGGECELSQDRIKELLLAMAECHVADFMDVEYFFFEDSKTIISDLQGKGTLVIASHHDFEETKRGDVLENWLYEMKEADPDLIKLAVMPKCFSDVLTLMEVGSVFSEKNPDISVVTISMDELGVLSRISGEVTGSVITFGTEGNLSAPGQIPREDLEEMLSLIHKYA